MDIFNRNNRRNQDDPFSKMMFGTGKNEPERKEPDQEGTQIDYMQLMASVETLVGLYDQFKPAIQKVNPMITKMLKKDE